MGKEWAGFGLSLVRHLVGKKDGPFTLAEMRVILGRTSDLLEA